jgi:anti-sigma factor (TIGR02949 family)
MESSEDKKEHRVSSPSVDKLVVSTSSSIEITKTVTEDGAIHKITENFSAFDFYSCEEAIKRLNDYLDSELDPAERADVLKHLQMCSPCLERFDFEQSLLDTLRKCFCNKTAPSSLKKRLAEAMKKPD